MNRGYYLGRLISQVSNSVVVKSLVIDLYGLVYKIKVKIIKSSQDVTFRKYSHSCPMELKISTRLANMDWEGYFQAVAFVCLLHSITSR